MTDDQKEIYFTEPIEFDAICSGMEADIRLAIETNIDNKEKISKILEGWLRNNNSPLTFIKREILNIWSNHPALYKKLKLRIYKLYKELKGK